MQRPSSRCANYKPEAKRSSSSLLLITLAAAAICRRSSSKSLSERTMVPKIQVDDIILLTTNLFRRENKGKNVLQNLYTDSTSTVLTSKIEDWFA